MFDSLNLFKSITCPFYAASTQTLTCDRAYCQFKHPALTPLPQLPPQQQQQQQQKLNQHKQQTESNATSALTPTPTPTPAQLVSAEAAPAVSSISTNASPSEAAPAKSDDIEKKSIPSELPSALQQLSDALQAVKHLMANAAATATTSAAAADTSTATKSSDAELGTTLATQLSSLSSMLAAAQSVPSPSSRSTRPTVAATPPSPSASVSSSSSSPKTSNKYAALSAAAPVYNPTPVEQLKRLKTLQTAAASQADVDNADENSAALKRKRPPLVATSSSPSSSPAAVVQQQQTLTTSTSNDSLKKFKPSQAVAAASVDNTNNNSNSNSMKKATSTHGDFASSLQSPSGGESCKPKSDLFTFSKLSLSQQVLKRYEMMNKVAPSPAAIADAKQQQLKRKSSAMAPTTPNDPAAGKAKVPLVILDTSESGTPKVPLVMRQRYLALIFENGKGMFATIEKACEKAAEQEKSIYDRSKTKTIYVNLAANLIKSLRVQQPNTSSTSTATNNTSSALGAAKQAAKPQTASTLTTNNNSNKFVSVNKPKQTGMPARPSYSHEMLLSGPKASRVSYSINRVKQLEFADLSPSDAYSMLAAYVLTDEQLDANSFPRWMEDDNQHLLAFIPTKSGGGGQKSSTSLDDVTTASSSSSSSSSDQLLTRVCKRCSKSFYLTVAKLAYASALNTECSFHWGKLRNTRFNKSAVEQRYSCCNGEAHAVGCELGKHVYDGDYDGHGSATRIAGYVQTSGCSSSSSTNAANVYALDCEMCYTTRGLELTRVTVVAVDESVVYESLVKPDGDVLDYNTRWSGLTEASLRNCRTNLRQVQAHLAALFNDDTILIGHSLDSDFKALKLIHRRVIDTSVVFPHKSGPPLKRALRNLMSEHLHKIIQEDADGHDSKEDATACIQLMRWKINEDLKTAHSVKTVKMKGKSTTTTTTTTTAASTATYYNNNSRSRTNTMLEATSTTSASYKLNNSHNL